MKVNLAYPQRSQVPIRVMEFSDGQCLVDVTTSHVPKDYTGHFEIISRASWADLQKILCVVGALQYEWDNPISLWVPYIGGRSDRRFANSQANYLKEVYAPIINRCKFDLVTTFDPHSDVTEAVIDRLSIIKNTQFVEWVLGGLKGSNCLVVPDGGALKKAWDIAQLFDEMVVCQKHRDVKTGKIVGLEIPKLPECDNFIIVDDICDYGQSFIKLSEKLAVDNLYLAVSHGIFAGGFGDLSMFKQIFTTNSFKDLTNSEQLKVYDIFR